MCNAGEFGLTSRLCICSAAYNDSSNRNTTQKATQKITRALSDQLPVLWCDPLLWVKFINGFNT